MIKRFKNPYHPSMERFWRLGGLDDDQLNRRFWLVSTVFKVCLVGCVASIAMTLGMTLARLIMDLFGVDNKEWFLEGLVILGCMGLSMALAWACGWIAEWARSLEEIRHAPRSTLGEEGPESAVGALDSGAAREWKDDAAWSGRELRVFDLHAMERLAELEERGLLISQSQAALVWRA